MPIRPYPDDPNKSYISQVRLPGSDVTYYIKDAEARNWINELAGLGVKFVLAWDGQSTPDVTKIPEGVEVTYQGQVYTGTLVASEATRPNIYLVWDGYNTSGRDIYIEYFSIQDANLNWHWEYLGNTDISIKGLVTDVYFNKGNGDMALGEGTTFTASTASVTFSGTTGASAITAATAQKAKLKVVSVNIVGGSQQVTGISSLTGVTASHLVSAASLNATRITTANKEATKVTFGSALTASLASAGTAVNVVTSTTEVQVAGFSSQVDNIAYGFQVSGEVLSWSAATASVVTASKTVGTGSITPYTFSTVNVPNITSSTNIEFTAISTTVDVQIPQYTVSDVDVSKVVSASPFYAATPAADPVEFATGEVGTGDGYTGAEIALDVNTSADTFITTIGTATAAAPTITVGTNDKVKVAVYDDIVVSVTTAP